MNALGPSLALVFSPESWVEELHRHVSHHGGARIRQIVVEPSVALDEDYDVLVVSDRWPALTHGFVRAVRERGRAIVGVFDPEEPAGKDHLVELGVDATVAADAAVGEFVTTLQQLDVVAASTGTATSPSAEVEHRHERFGQVIAVSGPRGSGVTEVAVGLGSALVERRSSVVLLDAHDSAPAVAGRLGLGLEPNLRTAVDACAHGLGSFDHCTIPVVVRGDRVLQTVAGHPSAIAASQVSTQDVLDVVAVARSTCDVVVVDVDDRSACARAIVRQADALVGVMHANPVGVVRGLEWAIDTIGTAAPIPLHVVVNHAPRSAFRREEIRAEVERTVRAASFGWCPHDRAVETASWDGVPVGRGPFHAACLGLADVIAPAPGAHHRRRTR